MSKISEIRTEIREKEFELNFPEDTDIPKKMRDFEFWKECCFKFTPSKINLLEYLYRPMPKGDLPVEEIYPILKKIGYTRRRFRQVLSELKEDGFIRRQNGVILTVKDMRVIRNITTLLILWPYANKDVKKPKGGLKDRKLRYYLPSLVGTVITPLNLITERYVTTYGRVSRQAVQQALDEGVDEIYEVIVKKKGEKNKARYYKLKS